MTNEQLEQRKAEMVANREKNAADIEAAQAHLRLLQAADHTMHGVIQDCDYWIEENNKTASNNGSGQTDPPPAPLLEVLKDRRNARKGATA